MERLTRALRRWDVLRHERARAHALGCARSVALGFAWPSVQVGGVRRHMESIQKYSIHPVAVYPSIRATERLNLKSERSEYHQSLNGSVVHRHAVFHSHVDPRFVEISKAARQVGKPWIHTYSDHFSPEKLAESVLTLIQGHHPK